jgi:hypothetical protein
MDVDDGREHERAVLAELSHPCVEFASPHRSLSFILPRGVYVHEFVGGSSTDQADLVRPALDDVPGAHVAAFPAISRTGPRQEYGIAGTPVCRGSHHGLRCAKRSMSASRSTELTKG